MVSKFGIGTGNKLQMATGLVTRWPRITGSVILWLSRNQSVAIRGFSLLELLVSVGIFVVITTAVVLNYRSGEQSAQLRLGAQALASTLRRLSEMAQTGSLTELCNVRPPTEIADDPNTNTVCTGNPSRCVYGCTPRLPSGGYGIRVAADGTAVLFADGDGNAQYNDGEELVSATLELPQGVRLDTDNTGPQDPMDQATTVVFVPPEPQVRINGGVMDAEVTFGLIHDKTDQKRTVRVRRVTGTIEVITP